MASPADHYYRFRPAEIIRSPDRTIHAEPTAGADVPRASRRPLGSRHGHRNFEKILLVERQILDGAPSVYLTFAVSVSISGVAL
jgi:hypothetical protein